MDRASSSLRVDFNQELISNMNAGAYLESNIVRGIVNNIASFYKVNKVYLTVEEKPYESGHLYFDEGEYHSLDKGGAEKYKK